ncbi:MAG: tetratricopeptide repeat protein [Vicinamibacterales bacterium]
MKSRLLALGSLAVTFVVAACAQPAPPAETAHGAHPTTPAAAAPRTKLLGNLGSHGRPIQTASVEAQQFFDEGLNLLYGFNHEESFKSFERAAALDPNSPMPHWGMALALGTNINDVALPDRLKQGYQRLAEAVKRQANGSDVERGLVAALSKRYVADASGDQNVREQAYSAAMGELSKKFPDDLDVATLHAESIMNLHPWKLYKADGTPEPWTADIVAILEGVIKRNPVHPGANHYYIHAVEASNSPGRASRSAQRLETLVPGAGHLVHMPAHIYIRTGEYARSAKANAIAAEVDEKYFRGGASKGFYAMAYYGHNLQFESAAAMYAGAFAQARAAAQKTVALADPIADQMAMIEPFAAQELMVLVRFGRWNDVLTAAAKAPAPTRTVQTALYHFARGAALAGTGKAAAAETELRSLKDIAAKIPKEAMVSPNNHGADVAAVAAADLTGRIAEANGDLTAAVAGFTAAVAAQDRLGYNEPPDWLLPERERLGAVLLKAKRASQAEAVFREDLVKHVGNPRSLYGLFRSLEAQKKPEATEIRQQFDRAWKDADVALDDDLYGVVDGRRQTGGG